MSCTNSCNSANSMFSKNKGNKKVKFSCTPSGASLSVVSGATTLSKMELCDWSQNFNQYAQSTIYLEAGAIDREIQYGGLGTQVTFLAIKVEYVKAQKPITVYSNCGCSSCTETNDCDGTYAEQQTQYAPKSCSGAPNYPSTSNIEPHLAYAFETNPIEIRFLKDLMFLTGTEDHRIPKVFLTNPMLEKDAIVTIIASTESITFDDATVTNVGDDIITVEHLEYTDLTSSNTILNVNSSAGTVLDMRWQDITTYSTSGDFQRNGRIIIVDDYVQGTINLSFVNEFHACQAFSLMKWALCDIDNNIITGNQPADSTPPTINYSSNFTTEIVLADFPPISASTCGTSGTNLCESIYISGTQGVILKEDLFTYLIDNATDDRDCEVEFTYDNLTLQEVGSTLTTDAITTLGKYHMTFDVTDNACNLQTDSFILNVKDTEEPRIILSDTGMDFYGLYGTSATTDILVNTCSTSGTAGTSGTSWVSCTSSLVNIALDGTASNIYLNDFANNELNKQNLLDLLVDSIYDERDGDILRHINNVQVDITRLSDNQLINEIDSEGFYEIRMTVVDSDGNIGTIYWSNQVTSLDVDVLVIYIKENQPPVISYNDVTILSLVDYMPDYEIDRTELHTTLVDSVIDDRDGIITTDILNVRLFQDGADGGTNAVDGTNFVNPTYPSTSGSVVIEVIIPPIEILYIDSIGEYTFRLTVTDSDGVTSIEDHIFNVYN